MLLKILIYSCHCFIEKIPPQVTRWALSKQTDFCSGELAGDAAQVWV